jgi:RNA polymerase sigma-70 factor (ECF subfamily)
VKDYSGFSDLDLISRTRKGDNEAFSILVSRYKDQVAKTVIGMMGDCMEADDVGQETFIRFYRSIDKFRGDSALGTYLTKIAMNLSLNELKKRKRNYSVFSDNQESISEVHHSETTDQQETEDIQDAVQVAIQELPIKFRTVIVLRMIEGYSTKETAEILDLPLGTVLSRLARAQQNLKDTLKHLI